MSYLMQGLRPKLITQNAVIRHFESPDRKEISLRQLGEGKAPGHLSDPYWTFESFRQTRRPPCCDCGGFLKPATISFGQNLVPDDLDRAGKAAAAADLVIALGSSLSVYPAASIPLVATRRGVPFVVINRGPTGHDDLPEVILRMEGDVTEFFPPFVRAALADL